MSVSIVIPNWNGQGKLRKNLPKVLQTKGIGEVIVVDDYSTDDSVEMLGSEFPQVRVITQSRNHGFSTTVNLGVKAAEGDFVFLLNTDAVPDKDCLDFILPHFKDSRVFSVGLNSGGSWSWARFDKGYFWHYMAKIPREAHQTLWVSGGSGVFRKSIWQELEGFDELFNRFYEEDTDLGYRATKRGYINLWEPKAKVEHYKVPGVIAENFSKEYVARIAQKNQLLFIWKNIHNKVLIRQHIIELIKKLLTSPKYWLVFLKALIVLPEVLKKRKVEERAAKFTDIEVLDKFSYN